MTKSLKYDFITFLTVNYWAKLEKDNSDQSGNIVTHIYLLIGHVIAYYYVNQVLYILVPGPAHFLFKEFCVCHFVYRLHFFMQIYTQILPPYTTHVGLSNAEIDKEQLFYKNTVLQQNKLFDIYLELFYTHQRRLCLSGCHYMTSSRVT